VARKPQPPLPVTSTEREKELELIAAAIVNTKGVACD